MDGTLFAFADYQLNTRSGELLKGGHRIKLQDQPFRLLKCLIEHAGEVVLRQELQHEIWSNDTFVDFEHGLNKVVNKIRVALDDDPIHPRFVETIGKRGYRFIAPIKSLDGRSNNGRRLRIAVLPFEEIGVVPPTLLPTGIADEIICLVAQSHSDHLALIERSIVSTMLQRGSTIREISEHLSADYVLKGCIRQFESRTHISSQLIFAHDQTHKWAAVYDFLGSDLLEMQTAVAAEIALSLLDALSPEHLPMNRDASARPSEQV